MKKILYFASALLAVFMTYSCTSIEDNPAPGNIPVTIVDENGNKYETEVIATFKGEVGSEVSLKLGVYDAFDIYGVDFGDGKIVVDTVCYQNGGLLGEDGKTKEGTTHKSATEFKGTVAGKGTIIIYGKSDLWYVVASGSAVPTSFDQEKLKKVVQFNISKVAVDAIDLTGLDDLEQFSFSQGSVQSVNVSNNAKLRNLTINNNSASTFESVLASLDLTKNTNLEQLNLMGASADKPGKLTKLDLSKNTKLTNLYAQYNALTEVILPEGAALTFINLQNNQLESIDLTKVKSFKDIYLNNNKLKAVDLSKLTKGANLYLDGNQLTELTVPVSVKNFQANNNKLTKISLVDCTASCKLENNNLTIATLPTKPASLNSESKIKKFTYNPQAEMEVTPNEYVLDLSAQAKAQGELTEEVATVFTVKAGDAALEAGKDYTIENGKITFLKDAKGVVVEMTSTAFPKLTVLKTKAFDVPGAAAQTASIFAATPTKAWDAPASAETEISSDLATIAGGKLFAINQQTDAKAMIKNQGGEVAFQCTNNNTFFKIVLDKALEAGDIISVRMQSRTDTDLGLFFAASDTRPNETTTSIILPTAQSQAWTNAPEYTVKANDGICGQTTFYAFRATGKSTYFNTFTITRK